MKPLYQHKEKEEDRNKAAERFAKRNQYTKGQMAGIIGIFALILFLMWCFR